MKPALLMLDEPVGGWTHMNRQLVDLIHRSRPGSHHIHREHNMRFVCPVERVIVFDEGRKDSRGPPEDIRANPEVIRPISGGCVA